MVYSVTLHKKILFYFLKPEENYFMLAFYLEEQKYLEL